MPRTWLQGDADKISVGSPLPPKASEMFRLLYGEDWCARMSAVYGRRYQTVQKWGSGHSRIPRSVLLSLRDAVENPRRPGELWRALQRSAEHELEMRLAAGKWAEKWLRLMLSGEASFPPGGTRRAKRGGKPKVAKVCPSRD